MFYILLFLILALPGGLLPPREKQKKRKAEGLLTDDEFVQLKKRKAELEIEQLDQFHKTQISVEFNSKFQNFVWYICISLQHRFGINLF